MIRDLVQHRELIRHLVLTDLTLVEAAPAV